jgi:hypothetical protein
MLPRSHADADRPQVPPGSVWITNACSILFLIAFACVIFTAPDQLRESLTVSPEPSPVSLQELADDDSRDPRNVILQNVRVESVAEREARDCTLDGIYRVHTDEHDALDQHGQEKVKLFLCADDVLLAGSTRTVSGGVWVTLLVADIANNMAGQPVAALAAEAVTWAIELTSITNSGICIVTASVAAPEGKPATRWSERFYSHCGGTSDFEQLLRTHLGAAADLAEQNDTVIAVLDHDDVIDVLKYSSRAMHDMVFQQGESKDRVGPARYGRFRFPTGLLKTDQEVALATEDSLALVSAQT